MISASISPIAWSQAISNQYYEIVEYQGIAVERLGKLDSFMEKALLPSLNRMGIKNVGVLSTEVPLDGKTSLFLVMPLENPNQVPAILKHLSNDSAYLDQGQDYLDTDYKTPVYERMRSELLVAFDCFPKLEVPKQKTAGKDRLFEMRVYESPTERMGVLKVQMFNNGEVPIFLDCGIHPVFFGQALVGDRMPNLTYLTVYDNAAQRDACWKRFQAHPDWAKLKAVEEYQGTVSKIHKFNLLPRSYSQF
ncbi:MAG: NIPSNAP family protein [Pirellulaceae bacterium]|nr:NIPSNAP family protein [Pirellulaceae bacterium]